jgi:hypothetical protein
MAEQEKNLVRVQIPAERLTKEQFLEVIQEFARRHSEQKPDTPPGAEKNPAQAAT